MAYFGPKRILIAWSWPEGMVDYKKPNIRRIPAFFL